MDNLEVVAALLDKSIWDIFKESCTRNDVSQKRVDSLWDAWVHENFIPEWMDAELRIIITKTTWPEGSSS